MSEEKIICSNPECGNDDMSDNVKNYSLEHYGIILCYPCQELVKSGKLDAEALKEPLKKKDTLEDHVSEGDEEVKKFDEKLDVEKVVDVDEGGKEEPKQQQKQKWDKTVETDNGVFMFREEGGKILCRNGANNNAYMLDVGEPHCSCRDFVVNKKEQEWCKHLKAADDGGYKVTKLPEIPKEVSDALAKQEKEKGRKTPKVKKEEAVAITILGKQIEMPVQTPSDMIMSEENALKMIKGIIGNTPKKDDVIESYAGIEELNADVVLSLCSYLGIQYRIVEKEIEKARMNVGKIYELTATEDQMRKYGAIAKMMPEVDIVTRCKVTVVAAWKDKSGNTRISVGVKEEILTPFELSDISKRGVNFIEAKAITKASKKALLSVLPVTHDGLKSKIKEAYHWK